MAKKIEDLDLFFQEIGTLSVEEAEELAQNFDLPEIEEEMDGEVAAFEAHSESLSQLIEFTKKNPEYRIATQTEESESKDESDDGSFTEVTSFCFTNGVHYVNRMKYYLYLNAGIEEDSVFCVDVLETRRNSDGHIIDE